ncbi:MAG TPA: NfeD family protein [Bradyrhizobium sp.]
MSFAGPVPGQPSFLPATPAAWHGVEHGLVAVISALFCSVVLSVWMRKYLPKMPYFNRLILTATSGTAIRQTPAYQKSESALDTWPFVGTVGVATSGLRPGGSARFPYGDDSRVATVHSASGYIAPGGKLVVQEIQGNRIIVRAVT